MHERGLHLCGWDESMSGNVYQASDLAGGKRVEFLNEAKQGQARLRTTDGTSLVMLPEDRLDLLEAVARWGAAYGKLTALLRRSEGVPTTVELGELAWLRSFDRADLEEFLGELQEAVVAASADEDMAVLDGCIRAWRITARQLADPLRRSVLLREHRPADFVEVEEPNDQD
jgi:hypothetical protein